MASEHTSLIAVLSAANFIIGMGAFMVVGVLPPFAEAFGISTAAAGWLMTAYALGYAALSPLLVALTGAIGRRRLLAAGLSVFAVANLIGAISPSPEVAFAARVLAAAGAGLVTPVAAAVAAGLSAPERQGRALSAVFFGMTLAQVLGVPAGSWLAYTFGWQSAFFTVSVLAIPVIWLIWKRVPAGLSFPPVTLSALAETLINLRLMIAVSFTAIFMGATYILYTYVAPLLSSEMAYARDGITLVLLLFGVGAVLGNLVGGIMTDWIGPTRWLMILALVQAGLMAAFSALPFADWMLLCLSMLWSLFGFSFMSAQQARLISLAPPKAPVLMSLNAAAVYVGAAFGAGSGALIISTFGLRYLGVAAGAVAILAAISLLPRLGETRRSA